jgi:hypothetical protein
MADLKTTLKEELDTARSIGEELKAILALKTDPALMAHSKAMLSIERKLIKAKQDSGTITKEEADIQKKIISSTAAIIKRMESGLPVTKESIQKLIESKKKHDEISKATKKNVEHANSLKSAYVGLLGKAGLGGLISVTQSLANLWKIHPILAAGSLLIDIFKQIVSVFKQLDEDSWYFRKTMGATRPFTKQIADDAKAVAIEFAHVGIKAKDFYDSQIAVAGVIGTTRGVTKEMGIDMSLMAAQVGVATRTSAEFLKTMGMVGKTTMAAQRDMLHFIQYASDISGTNLGEVMDDVAKASANTLRFLSRSPIQLIKAAIEAKKLGTSLSSTAKSAESLVDFQKSVAAEMEASVLMGESLNLQRARDLAYVGDNLGLQKELLRLAKESRFDNRDLFTKQAIATALGKSVEEVQSMLLADRERAKIQDAINKDPKLKIRQKLQDDIAKATAAQAKDYAEIARKQQSTFANQTRMMSISQSWSKIMMKLSEVFLPAIDTILKFVAENLETILSASIPIAAFWSKTASIFSAIGTWVVKLVPLFGKIGVSLAKWGGYIGKAFVFMTPILGWVTSVLNKFKAFKLLGGTGSKLIPGLGEVIMIIQGIYFSIKRVFNIFKDLKEGHWGKAIIKALMLGPYIIWKVVVEPIGELLGMLGNFILKGILGSESSIYKAIVSPFQRAWNWLKTTFFGESPSQLGMLIVKGLEAVQSMLINLLVSPFKLAWNLIKEIPFVGGLFKNIGTAVGNIVRPTVTADKVASAPNSVIKSSDIRATITPSNEEILKKLDMVVVAIDKLTAGFANGSLRATVNIDSQRIDTVLGRALEFKTPQT